MINKEDIKVNSVFYYQYDGVYCLKITEIKKYNNDILVSYVIKHYGDDDSQYHNYTPQEFVKFDENILKIMNTKKQITEILLKEKIGEL